MPAATPYEEALRWIDARPNEASSLGLAKLLLSMCHANCCFGFRECTADLDDYAMAIAVRLLHAYARLGEDHELVSAGRYAADMYPDLIRIGEAGTAAKHAQERALAPPSSAALPE